MFRVRLRAGLAVETPPIQRPQGEISAISEPATTTSALPDAAHTCMRVRPRTCMCKNTHTHKSAHTHTSMHPRMLTWTSLRHPIPTRTLQPILPQSWPRPNPYCAAHTPQLPTNHASKPPYTTTSQPQPQSWTHELRDVLTRPHTKAPQVTQCVVQDFAFPSLACPMPCDDTGAHASVCGHV